MNHAKFEKAYSVYSNSPGEARHIIDAEMMECLLHFKNQIKRDVTVSFVEGICYVAIAIDEDLLEPSILKPGDKKIIREYFFSILLIFSIINQLRLYKLM